MRHAAISEVITPDGELNTENLRTAQQCDVYLARGGEETYCPRFTYHGFRYAVIELSDPAAELCACTAGVRPSCEPPQNGEVVALVADNRIVALYEYHVDKGRFAPRCVFPIGVSRGCSDL